MNFWFWFYTIIGNPLVRVLCPCRVTGKENLPAEGPLIVCANHTSLLDPVLLYIYFGPKYRMNYMAKHELFKNPLIAAFLRSGGAFPVKRDDVDIGAIKTSMRYLKAKGRVMLFPEGKRLEPDESVEAKLGAVRIAIKCNAPILPVWLTRGKKILRRTRIVVGEPFKQDAPLDRNYDPLINELMDKIYSLEPPNEKSHCS